MYKKIQKKILLLFLVILFSHYFFIYNKNSIVNYRFSKYINISKVLYIKFTFFINKFIMRYKSCNNSNTIRVTVPEGKNIYQTASFICKTLPINKKKFIKIAKFRRMEGYLMPETYFVNKYVNENQIINIMYKEFKKKITNKMYERARNLHLSFHDIIILASIIEKEVSQSDERKIVASVFYNRLKRKLKLQSCATVLYAIGLNKVRLSLNDIKINSPYNTYKHFGLPPGPICSPSLDSIKAALYPKTSQTLFFVAKGNGRHLFARNFNEHKKNKQIIKRDINEKKKNLFR